MAEATNKSSSQVAPNAGVKVVRVTGTTAGASDTITVDELTVVQGVLDLTNTSGGAGTFTITGTSNVVTVTSGAATYNCVVYGTA